MGAEQSQQQQQQQRAEADGREIFESDSLGNKTNATTATTATANSRTTTMPPGARNSTTAAGSAANSKRHSLLIRQGSSTASAGKHSATAGAGGGASASHINSPTTSSRAPSPPLSVCSDLPYVSYTDRPIGDSPKIRNKPQGALQGGAGSAAAARAAAMANRRSYPGGLKPKRPQSTASAHSIVIVKPGAKDCEIDADLAALASIPQFLPVLRESITSATFTRDPEVLERLQSQHLLNICSRMQTHLNVCATHAASEQNRLVERTKIVSNSITTLFASFVDMQKTYAAYAEQFSKIRSISHQLSRCNSLLHENIASLEAINNFLEPEDRLEPFVWRTDDGDDRRRRQQQQQHHVQQRRGEAEGACASDAASVVGGVVRVRRT